jgi:hypothetical protein
MFLLSVSCSTQYHFSLSDDKWENYCYNPGYEPSAAVLLPTTQTPIYNNFKSCDNAVMLSDHRARSLLPSVYIAKHSQFASKQTFGNDTKHYTCEKHSLLGCNTMQFGDSLMFQRNNVPQSSGSNGKTSKKPVEAGNFPPTSAGTSNPIYYKRDSIL